MTPIILDFDYNLAKLVIEAETGTITTKGGLAVEILNWEDDKFPEYPIKGAILDLGIDYIHWSRDGRLNTDKISAYDLIIKGEL